MGRAETHLTNTGTGGASVLAPAPPERLRRREGENRRFPERCLLDRSLAPPNGLYKTALKPTLGFLCRFVIMFGLLIAPWPGWPETYATCLQQSATAVYNSLGYKGVVWFDRNPDSDKRGDTILYVAHRDKLDGRLDGSSGVSTIFSSRTVGYFPAAFMIALALATGIGWRRRLQALVWGLVWVHLFIALLLMLAIVRLTDFRPLLDVSLLHKSAWFLFSLFSTHPNALFAIVVVIWMIVTFRRDDWIRFLGDNQAGDAKRTR